jgi:CheY-like chemotaxis protein
MTAELGREAAASRAPRVLVVDDEHHVRRLLRDLLEAWGCRTEEAGTGAEGIRLFEDGGYDLVLTDLVMPGVGGLELVEAVRERDAQVGVIVLTGSSADVTADRDRLGFTLLRKPLDVRGLQTAVRRALGAGGTGPDQPRAR